jgi:transposase
MTEKKKNDPETIVREIKRNTRRKFTSEEKIRIVFEGLRGEDSIATICRQMTFTMNKLKTRFLYL